MRFAVHLCALSPIAIESDSWFAGGTLERMFEEAHSCLDLKHGDQSGLVEQERLSNCCLSVDVCCVCVEGFRGATGSDRASHAKGLGFKSRPVWCGFCVLLSRVVPRLSQGTLNRGAICLALGSIIGREVI